MPCDGTYADEAWKTKVRQLAVQQVRAKFPGINEKSSGFYRAVENRIKRIKL